MKLDSVYQNQKTRTFFHTYYERLILLLLMSNFTMYCAGPYLICYKSNLPLVGAKEVLGRFSNRLTSAILNLIISYACY